MLHHVVAPALVLAAIAAQETSVPEKYRLRFDQRAKRADRAVAGAIGAGLEWLRRHQDDDGKWDADEFMKHDRDGPTDGAGGSVYDVGVTGLALLAFLADGHTPSTGEHRGLVDQGIRWLVAQQSKKTGLIGSNISSDFVYSHLIASLALFEAYGLSGDRTLQVPAARALGYIERHRNPYHAWRYQPRDNDNDTSVTVWALSALVAAHDFGLPMTEESPKLGLAWLQQITDPNTGRTGYSEPGGLSSRRAGAHGSDFPRANGEAMTAAALFCRYSLGLSPSVWPTMQSQADLLAAKPPRWEPQHVDLYYWYYASQAMRQVDGKPWQAWSKAAEAALCDHQRTDAAFAGSWDPATCWGEVGGRVYSTAMAVLTLQAGYRFAVIAEIPPFPTPSSLAAVRRAWAKRQFGTVDRLLAKLRDDEGLDDPTRTAVTTATAALEERIRNALDDVTRLAKARQPLLSRDALQVIEREFRGLAPEQKAKVVLRDFRADPKLRAEIDASEQLRKLERRYDWYELKKRDKPVPALERIAKKYPDTAAGQRAAALAAMIKRQRR